MKLDPIGGIVEGLTNGLDELFTSDEEREAAKLKLQTLMQQPHILQAVANIEGAKPVSYTHLTLPTKRIV